MVTANPWHLRRVVAIRGMLSTTDLLGRPAERMDYAADSCRRSTKDTAP
ncbi:hypothetical protein Misp01_43140 [Microtetraspora sp. NBRC 13810]|nr:hypothetical protein [Microtetraspora sp. NBRC 13810]GLW09185.1 hypothetical protein Misp01_43140 [Microtetraspora sp. NBRC 13810]